MIEYVKLKKHYIMALAIMFVVVSLSGTTYSLFLKADVTDDFNYNTGTLDLEFVEDEQIYIQNALPIIDSEGLKTEPYTLTIKNTGTLLYQFDLKMLSSTEENLIDMKYIKFQINDKDPSTLYATNNVIAPNVLLYPDEEITFKVKVWLDISTPNDQLGKTFMAKLVTSGQSAYRTLDTSGANTPELIDGMIPVYYDQSSNEWKKADKSNMLESYEWYNYDNNKWANVITIKSSNKKIYDITGNNDLEITETRVNNGNYVTDQSYLDIDFKNYNLSNLSSIFRIKFNDINDENIYIMSNDKVSYYYDNINNQFIFKNNNNIVVSETYKIERGLWYILGYTYDGRQVNFYINGDKLGSKNISGSISSNESFKIGTDTTFKELSNIEVGDIYLYNDILSDEEINTNYKTNISVIYRNLLVGYNDFIPKTLNEYYNSSPEGTTINNKDIASAYVWIPRFKYKLWNVTGEAGIDSYDAYNKGIDIAFEKNTETSGVITCENYICYSDALKISKVTTADNDKYYTHPAFTNGDKELNGLWISKYEISTSSNECNNENLENCISNNLKIQSKFGNYAWRNNYLANYYENIKNIDPNNNYNIIKNTEWGAVSYLTHSKYGLCANDSCQEIGTNDTYISGNNQSDSTTNNMYGVFDLSGSASEFVMANYSNHHLPINNIIAKEDYDLYQANNFILGDATKEVSLNEGIWYNNYNSFVNETNNLFIRGGIGPAQYNGIFYYNGTTDIHSEYITTRIVIR